MMQPSLLYVALSIIIFLFILKHGKKRKICQPPGPPRLPIIGNLHQLDKLAPHLCLWKLSKKYGSLMFLQLGFVPTIVVSSAKMAIEVFKFRDLEFSGRPRLLGQQKLSYNGLDVAFTTYSEYWREMRKVCVIHLFSSKRVQSFSSIRENEISLMVKNISKFAKESRVVNLSETLLGLTSSLICITAFGKRYEDEGDQGRSRFHSLLSETQAMLATIFVTDFFPYMGWVDKVNGDRGRLEKIFKSMDTFYQEIIDDHLDLNKPKSEHEDFIDILLKLKNERKLAIDLTWDHIKAVLMNVFVAGTDTSAATVVWAMTALMKNPKVMKKAQEEVRKVIGENGFVRTDDLPNLPYIKAVVKEIMRLHPPVPLLLPRETMQSININGYDIAAKTLVFINVWAIGRDPEAWEDPEVFLPERFLGNSIGYKGQDFELIPFGAGRRGCPGIYMAEVTMELALANLLYSFEWEVPYKMEKNVLDMDVMPGLTMHKKHPLCLVAKSII